MVELLPARAPQLNPVEPLWSNLKGVELANLAGDALDEVIAAAERGIHRIKGLTYPFVPALVRSVPLVATIMSLEGPNLEWRRLSGAVYRCLLADQDDRPCLDATAG